MTDYIDTVHDRELASAGDNALANSYWYRPAEPGETCLICERELEPGETVDVLFPVTCLDCMDEMKQEYEAKQEEQNE